MLHLLPIRLILCAFVLVAAASVALTFTGHSATLASLSTLVRWSGSLVTIGTIVLFAAWRWIAPLQQSVFPYLGGTWSGVIEFDDKGKSQSRDVQLEIKHLLTRISMMRATALLLMATNSGPVPAGDASYRAAAATLRKRGRTVWEKSSAGARVSRPKNSITKPVQPSFTWRSMRSITCAGVPQMPCSSIAAPMWPP